jgi:hypothetical protein
VIGAGATTTSKQSSWLSTNHPAYSIKCVHHVVLVEHMRLASSTARTSVSWSGLHSISGVAGSFPSAGCFRYTAAQRPTSRRQTLSPALRWSVDAFRSFANTPPIRRFRKKQSVHRHIMFRVSRRRCT